MKGTVPTTMNFVKVGPVKLIDRTSQMIILIIEK